MCADSQVGEPFFGQPVGPPARGSWAGARGALRGSFGLGALDRELAVPGPRPPLARSLYPFAPAARRSLLSRGSGALVWLCAVGLSSAFGFCPGVASL